MGAAVSHLCAAEIADGDLVVAGKGISGIPDAEAPGRLLDIEPSHERAAVFIPRGVAAESWWVGRSEKAVTKPAAADGIVEGGGVAGAGVDGGTGAVDGGADVWFGLAGDGVRSPKDQGRGFREPVYCRQKRQGGQGPPGAAAEKGGSGAQGTDRVGSGALGKGSDSRGRRGVHAGGAFVQIRECRQGMGLVLGLPCGGAGK